MGHAKEPADAPFAISLANLLCGDGVLSALYRYALHDPPRNGAGSCAAASAVIWVAVVPSYYASQFNHLNPLLDRWCNTLFFCGRTLTLTVLLGAQMNAEMERQRGANDACSKRVSANS
jgi:hypothetical protein